MTTLLATVLLGAAPSTRPFYAEIMQNPLALMGIVLVVFYFLMIRPKQTQEKQRQDMLKQIKKGDRIQTIGGILGTVVDARENEVVVKVDETSNAKIHFVRSAVHRVVEEERHPTK